MPDAGSWSVARELVALAGAGTVGEACVVLGLVPSGVDCIIRELEGWRPGGAETYILDFEVRHPRAHKRLLFKACTAYRPDSSVGAIMKDWLERRRLLGQRGISTPQLFGMRNATLLEEWIPMPLAAALARSTQTDRHRLLHGLGAYAGALSALRFCPIEPFADLRSRGTDVVAIDFGEDLGPAGIAGEVLGASLVYSAVDWLEGQALVRQRDDVSVLFEGFREQENAGPRAP